MNRRIKLVATWLVLSAMRAIAQSTTATTLVVGSGGEFQVSDHGQTTISTTQGGPLLHVHQAGGGYGSGSTNSALILSTDGAAENYLLSGGTVGAVNFSLRAGGQAYFGGNVGIGTPNPAGLLDVSGTATSVGGFVISGANLDPNGPYNLTPLQNSAKLLQGWNRSGGQGEIDLISNRSGGVNGGFAFYDYANNGTLNSLVSFQGNGNVGIGTMSPGAKLDIVGNVKLSGYGASLTFSDGTTQSTAWTGTLCGGDYAESVDAAGDRALYQPGDVLVISDDETADVKRSQQPYSTMVSGIYSTKPGMVGRRQQSKDNSPEVPMAMFGIVPTKVTTENGSIKRGDLLVTSSLEGYAMKGTDHARMLGAVIGKALGNLSSGKGMIEVLVTLQ